MLTLEREQTTALDYSVVNTSIQETFTAIDRFEWQAVDEILQMREQQLYLQAGYKNFEEYCQRELYAWGGYRRINQLLGAKKVIDAVGELGGHIKNERQARPLLRLLKKPEKLKQAVAIALKDNPDPSVSDFAAAANIVVPQLPRRKQSIQEPMVPKIQEPVVPKSAKVTVSQQSHPRYGEEGTIEADAPNHWQQIVTFADGERLLINNTDLDAPSVPFPRERTYPTEYAEAIAAIKESPYKRLHVIIPIEDMLWASQQKPSVNQLWQECWTADPYGSRWMPLTSALGYSTFISAKKILSESGLFIFKPDKSIQDGRETVKWMVQNLHGSRMKEFWEKANAEKQEPSAEKRELNAGDSEIDAGSEEIRALNQASILGKTQSEQGFQETSRTAQEQFTNSTKEFVNCVSDTLTGNYRVEETAHAPLWGASPQSVQGVSEKEEDSPTANDCTSLALVDAVQGESALLIGESQDCGVEAIFPHEDTCSAVPVAQNEFSLNSAIANQNQGQLEQGYSASLLVENSVSGGEVKTVHEGEGSAAPVTSPEKWSHEAIVARSSVRPERMQKLKVAGNSGENPGFEYLLSCWQDDPALQIVIKKLMAKFPQWGIEIVDGELIEREE